MFARLVIGFVGVSAATLIACNGCKEDPGSAVKGDAGPNSAGLSPEQASRVVATVGPKKITVGDVAAALEAMDQFDRLRFQQPERRKELLNEMINVELLAQEAEEKGYDKDPLTQVELRIVARDAMLAEIRRGGPMPQDIPEGDVHDYYDNHKADFQDPERRRISVIVTNDQGAAKGALAAAERGLPAAEWGQLVRDKSVDPQVRSMPIDLAGDLGIVLPVEPSKAAEPSKVPDEVRAAAFRIQKVGDVLGEVVVAKKQFYVVRLTQKLDPHTRAYGEAERVIRVKLSEERIRAKEDAFLEDLKKRFPIQINEDALGRVRSTWTREAGASPNAPGAPTTKP